MTNENITMNPWPSLAPYGKTLAMPGGELFYYDSAGNGVIQGDAGRGKPTVLLVHGLGDEADTWRYVFPRLAEAGYRVIAPDLPGFGRSVWKGRISLHCQCRALLRLMEASGAASAPAILAGSSLGAGIAELVAIKRPDLVKALILIDGCFPLAGGLSKAQILMALPFIGKKWYRSFRSNHEGAWASLYPYYSNLDVMSSADREFLRERVIARVTSANQERGYFATLRSMHAFVLCRMRRANIHGYPGKILLIWGELDNIVPRESAEPFRQLRADADFALIAGAGHLPQQEKPDETTAHMLQFIKELIP